MPICVSSAPCRGSRAPRGSASSFFGEPKRDGEVRVSNERSELVLPARGQDAAVVFELGVGEAALHGLDTAPFDGEAVSVEAEVGKRGEVLRVKMVVIAGVLLEHAER